MKRCHSLKKHKEFNYVYRSGKSIGSRLVVLIHARSRESLKIGFSVSKKVGNAVVRNRVKRRMRESITPHLYRIKPKYKIIFIARVPIAEASFQEIEKIMIYLLKKADLIDTDTLKKPS